MGVAAESRPVVKRRQSASIVRRAASLAEKSTEWLVLLVLVAASIPPMLLHRQSLTVVPWLNLVDGSWVLDTCYKAANGIWFGRDVSFHYGPIYQWLMSAPSSLIGPSLGSINATSQFLPLVFIAVAAFIVARLLLPNAAAWRRAIFVLLAVVFWSQGNSRIYACLLAFAVFLRLTDALTAADSVLIGRAAAAATICLTACLVSADAGLYTVAALLLCYGATLLVHGRIRRVAKFLGITAACLAIGMVLVNWFMASPLDFRFWQSNLAIAAAYRWFEPLAIDGANTRRLLAALAIGIAVFGTAWWRRKEGAQWTRRPVFLLAGFALALFMMQSGLVRADQDHVLIGICPMMVLSTAIALDEHDSGRALRLALPALVVIATLVFAPAEEQFLPHNLAAQIRQFTRPIRACPTGLEEFDGACVPGFQAQILSLLSAYVDRNTPPGRSLVIFPFETAFGLTSRRDVAGGIVQSYLVNGDYLTQLEIAGLQQKRPLFGLYFPDGILGNALDSIPSFTRSPGLWFYLVGHYRGEPSPMPGAAGLITDDTRAARLAFAEETIAKPLRSTAVVQRSTTLPLGPVRWPASGADFVKLRLRLEYPFWWQMRKPSRLTLRMTFDNGTQKSIHFVVPPNHTSDVWIYPWDDRSMIGYFSINPAQWRLGPRSSVTALTLMVEPFDWVSVTPSNISIESVEAIRLGMN